VLGRLGATAVRLGAAGHEEPVHAVLVKALHDLDRLPDDAGGSP
jgi:hypothetical protein